MNLALWLLLSHIAEAQLCVRARAKAPDSSSATIIWPQFWMRQKFLYFLMSNNSNCEKQKKTNQTSVRITLSGHLNHSWSRVWFSLITMLSINICECMPCNLYIRYVNWFAKWDLTKNLKIFQIKFRSWLSIGAITYMALGLCVSAMDI